MIKSYKMAGIRFSLEMDFDYREDDFYQLFRVYDDEPDDYYYKYVRVESFKENPEAVKIYSNTKFDIYMYKGIEYRCFRYGRKEGYSYVICLDGDKGWFYYTDDYNPNELLLSSINIFNNHMFEKMLLHSDAVILHSSYVLYNDKAILFSAPSGTGKSTQARLWEEYAGAVTINGDRSILRKGEDGSWYVHGLPMCGSSKICINKSAPIAAIVILSQSKTNDLKRAPLGEAAKKIFSECTVNRWSGEDVNKVLNIAVDISSSVNVYNYGCNMEEEAVEVLRKEIDKM